MDDSEGLIPITIYVRAQTLQTIGQFARRAGRSPREEIARVVEGAVENSRRRRREPRIRALNSLSDGDSMIMLAEHFAGRTVAQIAEQFSVREEDVAAHLKRLTGSRVSARSKKPRPAKAPAAAIEEIFHGSPIQTLALGAEGMTPHQIAEQLRLDEKEVANFLAAANRQNHQNRVAAHPG